MGVINITTESKAYKVVIGEGVLKELLPFITNHFAKISKIMIITDSTVAKLHLSTLTEHMLDVDCCTFITPPGENAKTFEVYYDALSYALEQKLDRNSILLAFGGGAIGDLGGFVAATFMRGIPFIQIPTTILSHDSAVGGKVAINHPIGKNMIGCFYQPEAVFYDLRFLFTLPPKEVRSGFAEVIKHSLIDGDFFYKSLVDRVNDIAALDSNNLNWMLSEGIKVKGKIVEKDEREQGERAFLNFGHTLGHAIEAETGYGKVTHGEAIALGMIFALRMSMKRLGLRFELDQFTNWLSNLGYSTTLPKELSITNLIKRMKQDKKATKENIRMVLLLDIGRPVVESISENVIEEELKEYMQWGETNDQRRKGSNNRSK